MWSDELIMLTPNDVKRVAIASIKGELTRSSALMGGTEDVLGEKLRLFFTDFKRQIYATRPHFRINDSYPFSEDNHSDFFASREDDLHNVPIGEAMEYPHFRQVLEGCVAVFYISFLIINLLLQSSRTRSFSHKRIAAQSVFISNLRRLGSYRC